MKQLSLIPKTSTEHGGALNCRKRKTARPLHTKKVTHLVLKFIRIYLCIKIRVVEWGRAYETLKSYIEKNEKEVTGETPYQPRGNRKCKAQ